MKAAAKTAIAAIAIACTTAACASNGGGGGTTSPTPSPPPSSPPPSPPPPPASFFENNEYNRDYSKALIHASAAYSTGVTGQGVTIAVIDTGIDEQHAEFITAGKLSFASRDIYDGVFTTSFFNPATTRDHLDDEVGHGTGTASAAAASKLPEGDPTLSTFPSGMHGVAFGAQVLAIRADEPNPSCAPDCDFQTTAIAAAIDYAIANGADIINLSLGGSPTSDPTLTAALRRAVQEGLLVVASSGNDGNAEPDSPSNFAADPQSLGRAVAVGSVDENATISSFSNRAGSAADFYLVAPGEGLVVAFPIDVAVAEDPGSPCAGGNTCYQTFSAGTSFAAPQVAGALALLMDGFPTMSPEALLQILFDTAADLGLAGVDAEYGNGLIDLAAAFAPLGPTSINYGEGAAAAPAALVNAAPAGAFGDWLTASGVLDGAIMRDSYHRAFTISPEAPVAASSALGSFESAALAQRIEARRSARALGENRYGYALFRAPDDVYLARPDLATDDDLTPELSLTVREGPMSFAMGRGFLAPAPLGQGASATLTPTANSGAIAALSGDGDWASLGYDLGQWTLGMRAAGDEAGGFSAASLSRRVGPHVAGVEFGSAREDEATLGGLVGTRLGGEDGARASFAALGWSGPLTAGWRGAARVEAAQADLALPSYVHVEEDALASAWSLSAERSLSRAARLGVTLAQPLRAETGRVSLVVPVDVTEVNASVYETRSAALTPSGRELDLEMSLKLDIGPRAQAQIAARLAEEPAHVAQAAPEAAMWLGVRWTR